MMHGEFPVNMILGELSRDNLLPAILFRTSRRQCDNDVTRLARMKSFKLSNEQQKVLRGEIERVIEKYQMLEDVIYQHPHFEALINTGVGVHHAGQLLLWRLLLEELMTRGLLRMMIATGTVAAGVDFPARTVVVTAHSKRGSEGFNVLTSTEFQQMAGRAGRRGKDSVGICVIAPSPFSDARVIHEVSKRPPEPLRSAYFAAPSTVLNLLKYRNVDDLRYTVSRSLAAFLDHKAAAALREDIVEKESEAAKEDGQPEDKKASKRLRRKFREADTLEQRQEHLLTRSLDGLGALGYVENGALTEKGYWAANLCTSLVLELGEAISEYLLSDLTHEELAGLVGSIAGDPHRPYFGIRPNPIKKEYFERLQEIVGRVKNSYQSPTNSEVVVLPDAALTVITWMESESWSEFAGLLRLAGVADGDVARLVTQTADHLNQISRLAESHPDLARTAEEARRKILKPPLTESIIVD